MYEPNLLSLFWEGFQAAGHHCPDEQSLVIHLQPRADVVPVCSGCGHASVYIHDVSERHVRERDLLHYRVWLIVPVRRVRCATCGVRVEAIDWLCGRRAMTAGMARYVEALARLLPLSQVAGLLGLHWHTVRAIDQQRLAREVVEPDLTRVRRLVMDEFALFKGHRYATVVMDADTQQVLWVGEGHTREAVRPFFEWLGSHCQQVEAVAMDMNTAFDLEVQQHCPRAVIVYDLFHVIAKFGREVVDRVRVDQANQLCHDKPARRVIKQSRWLLLRNRDNLTDHQAVTLDELLAGNQALYTTYLLKDQLKTLWYAPDTESAEHRWAEWLRMALDSGIPPVIAFARKLKHYAHGIIASARYRLNTSVLEGMNNRIKVIKRMAYGYRNTDYFFLKIKAAFPGKAR